MDEGQMSEMLQNAASVEFPVVLMEGQNRQEKMILNFKFSQLSVDMVSDTHIAGLCDW